MYLNEDRIQPIIQSFRQYPLPADLYAIVRMQHRKSLWMEMTQGQCQKISQHITEGMGCQIFRRNGDTALVSAEEISPASLQNCLQKAIALCPESRNQRKLTAEKLFSAPALTDRKILPVSHGFDTVSPAQAKEALLAFHRELMNLDTEISCSTSLTVIHEQWRILRSDGSDVHFTMPRSLFRHEMSLWAEGKNCTLHTGFVGNDFSILKEKDIQEMIRTRVKDRLVRLRELVHAPQIPHGSYPILLDAHLTGGLVHEAFGHAAESDSVFRGSILSENGRFRTGLRLGRENLSITESPVEYDWGFQPFSANGFPRENVILVKNGILHQALADHFTADPIGVIPTGAERAESFSHAPIPRMSNIRLEIADAVPWDCDFEDVSAQELYDFLLVNRIADPDREYLFLSGYRGGQVNSTSGDFVFNCSLMYRFAHGKAVLHKPAIFSGNIFAVLQSVRRGIGRLHVRRSGMCGKSGQKVPTSGGGPLFTLIDSHPDIRIGGK